MSKDSAENRGDRRRFLKIVAGVVIVAAAGLVAGILKLFPSNQEPTTTSSNTQTTVPTAVPSTSSTTQTSSSTVASPTIALVWPRLKVINIKALTVGKALSFYYPLQSTPSMIVKIGVKADNGIGPDGDVVAFSRICQHQGCSILYLAGGMEGNCPCHGSQYDFIHNGSVATGPTTLPVPRVLLEYEAATGDIYAVGMGPPVIFGQGPLGDTNPPDLLQYDLQGGQTVTQITTTPM